MPVTPSLMSGFRRSVVKLMESEKVLLVCSSVCMCVCPRAREEFTPIRENRPVASVHFTNVWYSPELSEFVEPFVEGMSFQRTNSTVMNKR